MKKIKDIKVIILALILLTFTISYFVIVNKVSYAFEEKYDYKEAYNNRLNIIKKCAETYGKENLGSFNSEGILYITVQNLIDNDYLIPNEEGKIVDITNSQESLNNKKIRIKYADEKITAEIYN